jgi:hypothetical protein
VNCRPVGEGSALRLEELEERADSVFGLGCVPHSRLVVDDVVVVPAAALAFDDAGLGQISSDSLCGPLRDSDTAISRRVMSLFSAIRRSTWVWLVRNVQDRGVWSLDIRSMFQVFIIWIQLSR